MWRLAATALAAVLLLLSADVADFATVGVGSANPGRVDGEATLPTYTVVSSIPLRSHAGRYTNVKVGSDGLPLVCFNDEVGGGVGVATCRDPLCRHFDYSVVDGSSDANNARFLDMKLSPVTGMPVIAYSDDAVAVKVAVCQASDCSQTAVHALQKGATAYPSVAFGPRGEPLIAFYADGAGLRLATCADITCSRSAVVTVDPLGGKYPSVALAAGGALAFTHADEEAGALKYALCSDVTCSRVLRRAELDVGGVGKYNSMAVGGDGLAVAMYTTLGGALKVVHCGSLECDDPANNTIYTLDRVGDNPYGVFPELDIDPATGFPLLTYINQNDPANSTLSLAQCRDAACREYLLSVVAKGAPGYGRDSSAGLPAKTTNGSLAYISFLDYNGGDDKIARLLVLNITTVGDGG